MIKEKRNWFSLKIWLFLFFLWISFFSYQYAWGSPQGGTISAGQAVISQSGGTTTIQELTNSAIINWNSFNIGAGQLVQFLQPGALSAILNRVIGGNPSLIFGTLKSNGIIFLINPNGILFGQGSEIDTGSFISSTLNITNQDFLNGDYTFNQISTLPPSFIVNQGTIQARDGGSVVLLAPFVYNGGTIIANLGEIGLGAATHAVLSYDSSGLMNLVLSNPAGVPQDVTMTQQAYTAILQQVVNDKGLLPATQVKEVKGKIELRTANKSWMKRDVENRFGAVGRNRVSTGLWDTSGGIVIPNISGTLVNAGIIEANGASNLNAGSITLNSTQATDLLTNSLISANGEGSDSNGGSITVNSQGTANFESGAEIEAEGGASGNGGTVEVSDKTGGIINGNVNTEAPDGTIGTFLIDPTDLVITDSSAGSGDQDSNLPCILFSTPDTTNNTVSVGSLESQTSSIVLQAASSITIDNLSNTPANGSITLQPNVSLTLQTETGNITFNNTGNSIVTSGTGSITIEAGEQSGSGGAAALGNLTTSNQNVTVSASGSVGFSAISAGTGTVSISSSEGAIQSGTITANELILQAADGIGTSGAPLTTTVSMLQAYNTLSNGIFINNTGNLTLDDYSLGNGAGIENIGTGGITLNNSGSVDFPGSTSFFGLYAPNGGNITVNAAGSTSNITSCDGTACTGMITAESDGGNVSFTAGGGITIGVNGFADIHTDYSNASGENGGSITLNASGGNLNIENGTYLGTNTGNLSLTASGNIGITGGSQIYAETTGTISLNASGGITLDNTSNIYSQGSGDINLNAGGAISLANTIYNSANGNVSLTGSSLFTPTPLTVGTPAVAAYGGTVTLTATGSGGIGSSSNYFPVQASSLNLTASSSGAPIYLNDNSLSEPITSFSVTTNNGPVGITAFNVSSPVCFNDTGCAGDALSAAFTSGLNSFSFDNTGGNIILNSAINAGTGTVSLTTSSGYIANGTTPGTITANTLTLSSANGIGWNGTTASSISTNAANLTLTTTTLNTAQINLADTNSLSNLSVTTNNSSAGITASNISGSFAFSESADNLNAQFTGSALSSFLFDNTGGNIILNANINAGTGTATLTASSGYIANGTTPGTITANTLTLSSANGIGWNGTTASSISTNAANLTLTTTTLNTAQINLADSGSLSSLSVTTNNSSAGITASNINGTLSFAGGSGASNLLSVNFTSGLTSFLFDNTGGNIILNSGINAGVGTVSLTASSGYIANGTTPGTITANTLTLSSANGIGWNGTTASSISTNAANLTLTTTTLNTAQINLADSGSLSSLSVTTNNSSAGITASNINGTLSFAGGSGASNLLKAQFTGSALTTFSFDNTGGNIAFNAVTTGRGSNRTTTYYDVNLGTNSSSTANLTASGNISNGAGASTPITASTINLSAGVHIGAGGTNTLIYTISTLVNANANNGGVYLSNSGTGSFTIGTVTASGSGNTIQIINNSGNILAGTISGGAVTLITQGAGGGAILNSSSSSLITAAASLTMTAITGIGTAAAPVNTNTPLLTLTTTTANTAGIYVSDTSALTGLNLTAANSSFGITAGNINGTASFVGGSGGSDLLNASFSGALLTNFTFNNTAGNISFDASDSLNAGTAAAVLLASGGITSSSSTTTNITANELVLQAANGIGASADPLTSAVSKLTAYNTSSGNIVINNTGFLTVDDYYFNQGFGIENAAANGSITLNNNGTIDVPFTLASPGHCLGLDCTQAGIANTGIGFYDPNGGNISVYANGSTSSIIAGDSTYGEIAEADGGNLLLQAGDNIDLGIGSGYNWADTYTWGGSGTLTLIAGNNITATGYTTIETDQGALTLQAGNDITSTANNSIGSGSTILYSGQTNGNGPANINITAGNNINIANISTSGAVSITATNGNITDSAGLTSNTNGCGTGGACDVVAGTLNLTAGGRVGVDDPPSSDPPLTNPPPADDQDLYTYVNTLNANISGGMVLDNLKSLTIGTVTTGSDTDIIANGSILSDGIVSSGDISLIAAGSILDITNDTQTDFTGTSITLISGGTIGTAVDPVTVNILNGSLTAVGEGETNGISVNLRGTAPSNSFNLLYLNYPLSPGLALFNNHLISLSNDYLQAVFQENPYFYSVTQAFLYQYDNPYFLNQNFLWIPNHRKHKKK